jgi:hypothetical protein
VLELITDFLANQNLSENDNITDDCSIFYSNLARILGEILIYADQAGDRMINPWLDQWRSAFSYAAAELRDLSTQDIAIDENISDELKEVASSLEEVASLRLTLGCGPKLNELTDKAREKVITLKQKKIDTIQLSSDSKKQVRDVIITTSRKLGDLIDRSHNLIKAGKIENLQTEASELGYQLLKISQYNIEDIGDGFKEKLTSIARELHLVETLRLYMDGGKSLQAILDKISGSNDALTQLVGELQSP